MDNKVTQPNIDASGIYEGGSITKISAEELVDNSVAIKQLINSHNLEATKGRNKDVEIQGYKSEIEYLKTSPFTSILTAIMNIIGTIFIGIGGKLVTEEEPVWYATIILILGGLLVLFGSLANILYPNARSWFNPKKNKSSNPK